jgi:hypothetical protein
MDDACSFIIGIMPLALADSSGYTIATDITHDQEFASLAGFLEHDLERLADAHSAHHRHAAQRCAREVIRQMLFAKLTKSL